MVDALEVGDVLEDERIVDSNLLPYPLVHRVDKGLVIVKCFQVQSVFVGQFLELVLLFDFDSISAQFRLSYTGERVSKNV